MQPERRPAVNKKLAHPKGEFSYKKILAKYSQNVRKFQSTCAPVYREAVMFLVSTKKADLQATRIIISVHDVLR